VRDAMRYQQWRAAVLMVASLGCAPPLQHAAATTVAPPQPQQQPSSSRCKSDLDCSLNGKCRSSAGTCVCDKPWGGSGCGELRYKVTPAAGRDLFPINRSHNTWNGPIVGPVGGQYHLYDPLYGNFTGIKSLFRVEWIMHGVADQITGPYDWKSKPTIPGGICCCACRYAAMPASCGACVGVSACSLRPLPCHLSGINPAFLVFNDSEGVTKFTLWNGGVRVSDSPDGPWTSLPGRNPCGLNPAPAHHQGVFYCTSQHTRQIYSAPNISGAWTKLADINISSNTAGGNVAYADMMPAVE
jgi:hypothetical protein